MSTVEIIEKRYGRIEAITHHYPGYGEAGPSDEIKIVCDNRLLATEYNLGAVGEYKLIQKWRVKARQEEFAKILSSSPLAFSLCHFCSKPVRDGGGSVWDISYCSACDAKGLVSEYQEKKKAEETKYQKLLEEKRNIAENLRKQELAVRCGVIRSGTLLGSNDTGEFWTLEESGKKKIFFLKRKVEWSMDIQGAILVKGELLV